MSDVCLRIEALYKALIKANRIIEESIARTPPIVTSYPRIVSLGELTKGSLNVTIELLETLCKSNG
ncbi:MAG: hypothetical protein F7B59_05205 [Desulfurococcales archaeon]|nr:hypothetical protein [Desulfurococcales archaeon]